MNRREAVTALGAVVVASNALAQAKGAPPAAPAAKTPSLAQTARACVEAGNECFDHCVNMLSHGDNTMADCFAAVRQMLPVCETLEQLAKLNSPHLKQYAAVCATYCRDCEKACKPHAAQMAVCKTCMDACAACAAACEKA